MLSESIHSRLLKQHVFDRFLVFADLIVVLDLFPEALVVDAPREGALLHVIDGPELALSLLFLLVIAVVEEMEAVFFVAGLEAVFVFQVLEEGVMVLLPGGYLGETRRDVLIEAELVDV